MKLNKIVLKENVEVLSNEDMMKVLGGGSYRCCCGMGTDINCIWVDAQSQDEAMDWVMDNCPSGGGCF